MNFIKPALSLSQQVQKWQARGLAVPDTARAMHYLKMIGYYRFSAYTLPFQVHAPNKPFQPGTTFEQVLALYVFDRELRLHVMDAIERIEVAVRSCLINHMCVKHGAHWFMDAVHFKPLITTRPGRVTGFDHRKFLDQVEKELGIPAGGRAPRRPHNEVFINHYYTKYTNPYLPPSWMVFELLSIGSLSMVYANLKDVKDRAAVAATFGIDEQVLVTWLHSLSYLRNLCAHHCRLWNRQMVIKPLVARKHSAFLLSNDRFYAMAVLLWELLRTIAPDSIWHKRLSDLFVQFPTVPSAAMGFPANWKNQPFWNLVPPAAPVT